MALDKLKLELVNDSGDNYEYSMYPITNILHGQEKPHVSISLPGQGPKDNIMMGFQGMTADLRIDFKIWNDGSDRANGSISSGVEVRTNKTLTEATTVNEQYLYLLYYMQDPTFDAKWKLTHTTGDRFDNLDVVVTNINIPALDMDSEKWLESSMDLTIGESI